jgi:hypothetical protein
MSSPRETVLIAQDLYERLGPGGVDMADARSDAMREAGDVRGAQFWRDVSRAMIMISARPNAIRRLEGMGSSSENVVWGLMQRIEGYRHLASEAEGIIRDLSSAAPELGRLAKGWRELAATLEDLASTLNIVPPVETFQGTIYELN